MNLMEGGMSLKKHLVDGRVGGGGGYVFIFTRMYRTVLGTVSHTYSILFPYIFRTYVPYMNWEILNLLATKKLFTSVR